MRKTWVAMLGASLTVAALVGCKNNSSQASAKPEPEEAVATKPSIPIPADSPFAKVKVGMGKDEVYTLIGRPTNENVYQTGKAWIPFHFSGSDNYRTAAHYKGMGIITFSNDSGYSSGMNVLSVDYDPTEPGFERTTPQQ